MSIVIIYPDRRTHRWIEALHTVDPALKVEVWPEVSEPEAVTFALCWNQPPGALREFPNLKCVSSLGAGVEHLVNDTTMPPGVSLVRLVDEDLKRSMAEYVTLGVLKHFRRFGDYRRQQDRGIWKPLKIPHASKFGIGIMGFGEIGRYVGRRLSDLGFTVHGWTRRPKQIDGFSVYSGQDELGKFLAKADILVCLLPLTDQTKNILNADTFSQLPSGAYLINVGRGAHLVEEDLLAALDSGHLSGALLDVFRDEPLPEEHPFWCHGKITITPHIASVTNPGSAAAQIIENYRRAISGQPLLNVVDVERGY
jgi:glyoxylate/hydroxypyruvate reductase A